MLPVTPNPFVSSYSATKNASCIKKLFNDIKENLNKLFESLICLFLLPESILSTFFMH